MEHFNNEQATTLPKDKTAAAKKTSGAIAVRRTAIIASNSPNGPAYTDAIARVMRLHKKHEGMAAILPKVHYFGTLWMPATDPNRKGVEAFSTEDPRELELRRNGSYSGEGITITDKAFNKCFVDDLGKITPKKQVTILLVDGTKLIGYVVNTGRTPVRIYLPKNYLPKGFALPVAGEIQPVIAIGYILG